MRKGRNAVAACLASLVLLAVACAGAADTSPCPNGAAPWVKYELFMGRSGPSGEVVDDAAWASFVEQAVTPRFPDGLTVLDAAGQWRDPAGVVQRERAKLLVILAPTGESHRRLIGEISGEYKLQFGQESVLRVVTGACVSFD